MSPSPSRPAPQPGVADLQEQLARERRISSALREVGNALGTTLDLDDLLELVLDRLTDLLNADRATLYLLDDEKKELVSRLVAGGKVRSIRVRVGHGIAGMVAQTGKPYRIRDAYDDTRFEQQWDALTGYRTTSMLAAPLKNHLGRTIGVIQVLNKQHGDEFTEEDEALLTALSTQAAVAIDNSRLFLSLIQKNKQLLDTKDQLERRLKDLELLFQLERTSAQAQSIEELLQAVLGRLCDACDATGASVLLAEEETGDLVTYVFDPLQPNELGHVGIKAGEGFLSAVMHQDQPLKIESAREDARWHPRVEGAYPFAVDSVLALPVEGEDRPLGAIGLFGKRSGAGFSDEDSSLLRLIAANTSTAVRLFRANRSREVGERLTTIGRLLSQVTHDFKTPMTVISGYVQLMADCDDPAQRTEYAEEILLQFDQLTAMQREVLEFARGERSLFLRRVFLNKFFADITRQLTHELANRPVELEVEVDTKAVARIDQGRVTRAIFNLVRNALEAMGDEGGQLTLRGFVEDDDLVLQVADSGPGIPPEIEGRLFQSFVTAKKAGGTGLGLAIVKKIADEHAGRIEVESSDQGATFTLRLPKDGPDAPEPTTRKRRSRRPPESKPPKGKGAASKSPS